jgi:hypothetical protein
MTEAASENGFTHEPLHHGFLMNQAAINHFQRASFMKVNVLGLVDGGHAADTQAPHNAVFPSDDTAFGPEVAVNVCIDKRSAIFWADGCACRVRRLTCGTVSHDDAKEALETRCITDKDISSQGLPLPLLLRSRF